MASRGCLSASARCADARACSDSTRGAIVTAPAHAMAAASTIVAIRLRPQDAAATRPGRTSSADEADRDGYQEGCEENGAHEPELRQRLELQRVRLLDVLARAPVGVVAG